MATYYVDPNAGGNDDGTSWTDAWSTLQRAIDGTNGTQPVAGDIVYCRNSGAGAGEALSAPVTMDGNSGTEAAGHIRYVGCNASGTVDGTRYQLDAQDTETNCVNTWTAAFIAMEHFEYLQATGDGVEMTTSGGGDGNVFVNCIAHDNGAGGWEEGFNASLENKFFNCRAYDNVGAGWDNTGLSVFYVLCACYQNGEQGFDGSSLSLNNFFIHCAVYDNGNGYANIEAIDDRSAVIGCVIDGTGQTSESGITIGDDDCLVFANRITNTATGIDGGTTNIVTLAYNLFDGNTTDISNGTAFYYVRDTSNADTNKYDPDADDGYSDASTADYNLKASRTYNGDGNDTVGLGVGS